MQGLNELAGFLAEFERPGFEAGQMKGGNKVGNAIQMPYVVYNAIVESFVKSAYKYGWVVRGFDWTVWAQSEEAARLRDDEEALAAASADQLSRLLTVCIRQDRFFEGVLLDAFQSGFILRIVRRARVLVDAGQPSERG